MSTWRIIEGDCRDVLRALPAQSVHTCVTSPPYFGLRDYGTGEWEGGDPACGHKQSNWDRGAPGNGRAMTDELARTTPFRETCGKCGARRVDRQIGLEPTPDEFVATLVVVFREVRRVLRDDGTVWLNLGDSYSGPPVGSFNGGGFKDKSAQTGGRDLTGHAQAGQANRHKLPGIKSKDLLGVPWMVAFALRADGWFLRSDIIWSKPNPMPESVTDRPTKAHEYVFLLSKGPRYFYDADAIREDATRGYGAPGGGLYHEQVGNGHSGLNTFAVVDGGRNKRSVWTVATQPYAGAHFATFPPKLIEPCILAGAPERACGECGAPWVRVTEKGDLIDVGHTNKRPPTPMAADHVVFPEGPNGDRAARMERGGFTPNHAYERRTIGFEPSCSHGDGSASGVVLDPFAGAGTTGMVALRHNRSFIGVELNPVYADMARWRIRDDAPLLNGAAETTT
jgi:DNA modification methylase